jgi:hypothetical protein
MFRASVDGDVMNYWMVAEYSRFVFYSTAYSSSVMLITTYSCSPSYHVGNVSEVCW